MKDPKCFNKLTTKNGFTLSEVRRIRKEIRDNLKEGLGFVQVKEYDPEYICELFSWNESPQEREYWLSIDARMGCPHAKWDLGVFDD